MDPHRRGPNGDCGSLFRGTVRREAHRTSALPLGFGQVLKEIQEIVASNKAQVAQRLCFRGDDIVMPSRLEPEHFCVVEESSFWGSNSASMLRGLDNSKHVYNSSISRTCRFL